MIDFLLGFFWSGEKDEKSAAPRYILAVILLAILAAIAAVKLDYL